MGRTAVLSLSRFISQRLGLLCLLLTAVSATAFSPFLKDVMRTAGFSDDEIQQVKKGKVVNTVRNSSNDREIILSFACLTSSSPTQLKDEFLALKHDKHIDKTLTEHGILQEGDIDELEELKLEPNGNKAAQKYINAKPGTDINLSSEEIASFNELKKASNTRERVEERLRDMLLKRYRSYREHGLKGFVPFARAKGEEFNPVDDLLAQKTRLSEMIHNESPAFWKHLMNKSPESRPEGLEESFSWRNMNGDGNPSYALVHRLALLDRGVYVLAERVYYSSCVLNCVQSTGGAFPVEDGTALVFSMRSSTDMITGFGGAAMRAVGTKMMKSLMVEQLERYQQVSSTS